MDERIPTVEELRVLLRPAPQPIRRLWGGGAANKKRASLASHRRSYAKIAAGLTPAQQTVREAHRAMLAGAGRVARGRKCKE